MDGFRVQRFRSSNIFLNIARWRSSLSLASASISYCFIKYSASSSRSLTSSVEVSRLQLSDKALCFLDSGRHLLVVEFLHALPIAQPAPVKAAEIHSIPSKSTYYYFNGIEREFTLTQLESNRRNSWCSNWTECEDVKHNYKARASQEQQGLRTFFNFRRARKSNGENLFRRARKSNKEIGILSVPVTEGIPIRQTVNSVEWLFLHIISRNLRLLMNITSTAKFVIGSNLKPTAKFPKWHSRMGGW